MTTSLADQPFSVVEREILRVLFERGKPVDVYEFHVRFQLSPSQLLRAFRALSSRNLIHERGDIVELTQSAPRWIIKNRREIFMPSQEQFWKTVPARFCAEQWPVDALYQPRAYYDEREFFDQLLDSDEDLRFTGR